MDDWQLLQDYATNHSEEAFHALVDRYAGMVYHAALRQTGNPHAAEEAGQVVFIALAQKAGRIPRQATLYGWLFRATRFAVLNQARANANRERREQNSLVMHPTLEANEADSTWERLTPQLNDALDGLSAADRELLLIRFFGGKSHREAAEALGVSEETARKRLSRAIERLRDIFARRGVVVSSVVLSAALAARGAQAASVELASSWAAVALAKAATGAAASSAGGLLAFLTSAKTAVCIAVLVLGGAAFAILKTNHRAHLVAGSSATNLGMSSVASGGNNPISASDTQRKPALDAAALALALDKVKAALHDPNPTAAYPNPVMQEAIAGLGGQKKAALPILEEALTNADAVVRLRAVDGLGTVGPEAGEAAPLLLGMLRDGGFRQAIPQTSYIVKFEAGLVLTNRIYTDNMLLYALGQIHPSPEILLQFAQTLKENRSVAGAVNQAISQFGSNRRRIVGDWLWELANEDAKALNETFRPLLHDPVLGVRLMAARSLTYALGKQADTDVFPVAVEMLQSNNVIMQQDGLSMLQEAGRDLDAASAQGQTGLYAPRLGPYLNDTASALGYAAYNGATEQIRITAAKMLDALVPDLSKSNPALAAELEQQRQMKEFTSDVRSGDLATSEIEDGLKKFPEAAPDVATYFARNDASNGAALLPAFADALSALAPSSLNNPVAGDGQRAEDQRKRNERQTLANAMQQMAPDRPKPIFGVSDVLALGRIMHDPSVEADPGRSQKVADARNLAGWGSPTGGGLFDVSPDQVRRLLAAMKNADPPTYDALAAKVKEIDPHFFETPAGDARGN